MTSPSFYFYSAKTFRRMLAGALMCGLAGLPALAAQAYSLNSQEQELANIFTNASGQKRPALNLDPVLSQVARARAADMANRNYFAHENPDGHGPNYLVRQAGYELPSWWGADPKSNYIESIAGGYSSASGVWSAWMDSTPHRTHLLATNSFYADQTSYGIGYACSAGSTYQHYWVIITAPPRSMPVAIQTPANNSSVTESTVTASGTAVPDGVDHIEWRVENTLGGGTWQNATGIAQWTAQVTGLVPGTNILHVRSVSATGGEVASDEVSFLYAVNATLTVSISGSGSVSAGFADASQRLVGVDYTVKATPVKGWIFTGWTGGVTGSDPTLTFTMQEGLELAANFIPNPYVANAGGFQAFVDFAGQTGNLQLNLNAKGGFSGSLAAPGSKPVRFKGVFDPAGAAQVVIGGKAAVFAFDMSTGLITLTLEGQTVEMQHAAKTAGTLVGRYHLALPGTSADTCPEGTGYAVVKVAANGSARITGRLGDAATFSVGAVLSTDGTLPVFASLAKGSELAAGYLTFSATSSGIDGELAWVRSANPLAVLYPEGFDATINATGGRYVAPATGQAVLADGTLTLGSGNLGAEIVDTFAAGVAAGDRGITVRVNAASGVVTGQFVHPADNKKRSFGGLVQPARDGAFGLFVGVNETGYVNLAQE